MTERLSRPGLVSGVGAYVFWGFAPLFWRLLAGIPATQLLAHRVVWACAFLLAYAAATRQLPSLRAALRHRSHRMRLALAAACVGCNWFVFVYAVMTDRVLDVSLGYFINPLVTVALGYFVLREPLRRLQWIAVAVATVGVLLAGLSAGGLPWISVVLAVSFGTYGLVRKTTPVAPVVGSTVETLLMAPLGLLALSWFEFRGVGGLTNGTPTIWTLLVCTGPVTAIPLLLFVRAARSIPLTVVGFLQYVAPTLQFGLAVFVFDEPLETDKLMAFGLVWVAVILFAVETSRRAFERSP